MLKLEDTGLYFYFIYFIFFFFARTDFKEGPAETVFPGPPPPPLQGQFCAYVKKPNPCSNAKISSAY